MLTPEQLEEARKIFEEQARAARLAKKMKIERAQRLKEKMSFEERIELLNTPVKLLPEELQPGMTIYPQRLNFVRMHQPHLGFQQETAGSRILRFRNKYNMSQEEFMNICNKFAERFDVGKLKTRIKKRDMTNYEDFNVTPKIDKMTIMADAMGYSIDYFAGYGSQDRKSKKSAIEARFRKRA